MKEITEDYVSEEVAKLLKERGFDEECRAIYEEGILRINTLCEYHNSELSSYVCAPTLQMALKWLREVHRIETHIVLSELNADNSRKYMFDIYSSDINRDFDSVQKEGFNSYEQAVEAAILYVLKNLI